MRAAKVNETLIKSKPISVGAQMQRQAKNAATLLKAMAHQRRLQILCLLVEGERSVGEINQAIDLSQSALSQHLAILREQGLVSTRKSAQVVFYSIHSGPALEVIKTLHSHYCKNDKSIKNCR